MWTVFSFCHLCHLPIFVKCYRKFNIFHCEILWWDSVNSSNIRLMDLEVNFKCACLHLPMVLSDGLIRRLQWLGLACVWVAVEQVKWIIEKGLNCSLYRSLSRVSAKISKGFFLKISFGFVWNSLKWCEIWSNRHGQAVWMVQYTFLLDRYWKTGAMFYLAPLSLSFERIFSFVWE